jgi:hypothetical protein
VTGLTTPRSAPARRDLAWACQLIFIMQGVVPNILKFSRVTPEYKNGLTTDPTNYRPITLLSPFSKILERIISDQLTSFIGKHEILFHISLASSKDTPK